MAAPPPAEESITTPDGTYGAKTITGNNITITGTASGAPVAVVDISGLTINSGSVGGSISVTGNVIGASSTGAAAGIIQSSTITGASGSNISFISNNKITQAGGITLAANTSGTAANILYDTTTGNKDSKIITGALTLATDTSTSLINYIIKSAGSAINSGAIGVAAKALPGYVLLDNTFGGTAGVGGTPTSGFINTTTNNLVAFAIAHDGVYIDNNSPILAKGNITINGVSNHSAYRSIYYLATITSQNGDVTLNGGTTTGRAVYNYVDTSYPAKTITGNNITITGTASGAPVAVVDISGLTINSGSVGGNISVTGNVIGASSTGAAAGINQSSTITGASGSNISFISNNKITQAGGITLAANTSGTASNITYNTTAGNQNSTISNGPITLATGSLANINFSALSSGSAISINSAVSVPGTVTLDNTYGCSGSSCSPSTGYINTSLANWTNFASVSTWGVYVSANLTGNAIIINGINTTYAGVTLTANLTATNGNITINGVTTSGMGVGNKFGGIGFASLITANSGAVTINGTATTSGDGITFIDNNTISAKSITAIGQTNTGAYAVRLNVLTIVAGGTNLNVTGYVTNNAAATGIEQSGAITDNAIGSNISFITNGKINQTGAISLVANSASTAVSVNLQHY
jgi:mucin-19